jgi:hypothetical protein
LHRHLPAAQLTHKPLHAANLPASDAGLALVAQFAVCRVAVGAYYWALMIAAVWRLPAPRPGETAQRQWQLNRQQP